MPETGWDGITGTGNVGVGEGSVTWHPDGGWSASGGVSNGTGVGGSLTTGGTICTPPPKPPNPPTPPPPPPPQPPPTPPSPIIVARDPNEKLGPGGHGPANWVRSGDPFPYRINFENLGPGSKDGNGNPYPTFATAPAQRVTVTDALPPGFDWSTFRITELGFGDTVVPVPGNSSHYSGTVMVTVGGQTFDVEMEAGIDFNTGRVTVVFQSLDRVTGLPPGAGIGFLPPEDASGRGKGHVSFLIRPKAGLPNGTAIRNVAEIRFDTNEVIATNQVDPQDASKGTDPAKEALVTLDNGPPTVTITLAPAGAAGTNVDVRWIGNDLGGAGIKSYDVSVSLNGAPYEAWLTKTTQTQAIYPGYFGQQLEFRVTARDFLNQEALTPAAATMVIIDDDYLHWRAGYFGNAVGDPAQRNSLWGDDADPDNDGRSNLQEFLAATNPLVADGQFNPTTRTEGDSQIYSYRVTKVANHLVDHYIEWSPDGVRWFTGGLVFRVAGDHAGYRQMEAVLVLNGQPPVHFRQKIQRTLIYAHWIYEEGASFLMRGPDMDPNGDLLSNGLAYAFGMPAVGPLPAADYARLPRAIFEPGATPDKDRAGIDFRLPANVPADVELIVESSPNLGPGNWQEIARRNRSGGWLFAGAEPAQARTYQQGSVQITRITERLAHARFYRIRAVVVE